MIERLRAATERSLAELGTLRQEMPKLSPYPLFVTKAWGEVRQRIPRPDERSPKGPRTHILPQLLMGNT